VAGGPTGPCDPARASTFVISITPFGEGGTFDEPAVRGHFRRLAAAGIGVYVGGGGSGEGYALTGEETRRLLEIAVDELKGKVPARAMGCEPRNSADMIDFVEMVEELGIEATQIYSLDQGHGHRPTHDEIFRYFDDILGAIRVPAILSTHQSVGYQVPVPMLVDFAQRYEHLVGVNVSHQDLLYLTAIVDALSDRLDIHVGGPHLGLTALSLGANGYLSSEGNLAPNTCVGVIEAYRQHDAEKMTSLFGKVLRLSGALYPAGGIRATKAVLNALGLPGGYPRPPQLPVPPERAAGIVELVTQLGVPGIEGW
jgi:4-hydroxy-tetrahydrodipicolinate synthase